MNDRTESAYNIGREPSNGPDYSQIDSIDDLIRDVVQWGRIDELRERLLGPRPAESHVQDLERIRGIAFEFAGAKNPALTIAVFIHATGIAEFGTLSLRDYAEQHGVCHEWFRQQVIGMCRRLNLSLPNSFRKGFKHAA
jgi:hypothetical protein